MGNPVSLTNLLINASLYDFPVNGVTWTLNVEMVGVAFVLLTFFAWRVGGFLGLLIAAMGIGLMFKFLELPIALTFRNFWLYFVIGMLIPSRFVEVVTRAMPPWSIVPVLFVVIFFKSTVQQLAIGLVALLFYNRAGRFGEWLVSPIAQFLGRISYSFYLFNFVVFVHFCSFAKRIEWVTMHPLEAGLIASVLTIAATIPLAYLSMRLVEMPGIAAGRYLTFRKAALKVRSA